MLGACCTCQESHRVRPSHSDSEEDDLDLDEGEAFNYVMAAHEPSFGGGQCEGTGTMPQAVFRE